MYISKNVNKSSVVDFVLAFLFSSVVIFLINIQLLFVENNIYFNSNKIIKT